MKKDSSSVADYASQRASFSAVAYPICAKEGCKKISAN